MTQPEFIKAMKVALVSFDFGEYCIRLAGGLADQASVLLLLAQQEAMPYALKLDPRVDLHCFAKPRLRNAVQQALACYSLVHTIQAFAPDVIHLQQGHLWFNLALPLLREFPLVITSHDVRQHIGDRGAQNTPQAIMDFGFHQAAQLIVHAERLKQLLSSACRISPAKVHVIPHIVLGDETAHVDVPDDDDLILFFGRIWKYKGLEYLIRAEPIITEKFPSAKIMIAGRGEDIALYRAMMVHSDRFIVHNEYIPDYKRAELFRKAAVVVLPYIEASQSGVIPLAYTFQKPVVATTVGGLPEQVDDSRTGYLVPPADPHALARAILTLLQDREHRRELGANGKRKIDTECCPAVVAGKTLDVYRSAVQGRRRATARLPGGSSR
jgi:glycosyltransferase involved in cell wall biosynthesis